MPYRDDREALRARNEDLQRELDALRAKVEPKPVPRRGWRVLRAAVPLAVLGGLVGVAVLARAPAPTAVDPSPPVPTSVPELVVATASPPIPAAAGKARPRTGVTYSEPGSEKGPQHVYRGLVKQATGAAPVKAGDECTIKISSRPWDEVPAPRGERGTLFCLVNFECGDRADGAFSRCWFDEEGRPHGKLPFTPPSSSIVMEGRDLELVSGKDADRYTLSFELDDKWPGFGPRHVL